MNIHDNEILININNLLIQQSEKGLKKYGKTVDPYDYSAIEWIEHAQQELIDQLVYLECLKGRLQDERSNKRE